MDDGDSSRSDQHVRSCASSAMNDLLSVLKQHKSEATCAIGILSARMTPSSDSIQKVAMDVNLGRRMLDVGLNSIMADGQRWIDDDLLVPFDQRGTQEDDIRCMLIKNEPELAQWIQGIPSHATWPTFDMSDTKRRKSIGVFNIIAFNGIEDSLIGFSYWTESLLIKRKGWTAVFEKNRFSLADNNLIHLPQSLDFFVFRNVLFTRKWKNFELSTGFRKISEEKAKALWKDFADRVNILSPDEVWKVISKSVRHQNTIIKSLGEERRVKPTTKQIEDIIHRKNMDIRLINGQIVVDLSNNKQIGNLMSILSDSYVTSDMTSQELISYDSKPVDC